MGYFIHEYELNGSDRARYGARLFETLAARLEAQGLKGVSATSLKLCRSFYRAFSEIGQTASAESNALPEMPADPIRQTLSDESPPRFDQTHSLSWSHYVELLSIENSDERRFYEIEAEGNDWSLRELKRQIASSLYQRLALSRDKEGIQRLAREGRLIERPADLIRNPYVLEFLGLEERPRYSETDLESAIIGKLQSFLLELGKGFLFEARQKRFTFENDHFFIDLVFYNRLLRCYVLIDLKRDKLTHQDLGQMQMYVNYFDRFVRLPEENPIIGILLCSPKNDALVELTLPKDANIFASQYQLYLPSKEEFRRQLEAIEAELEAARGGGEA